MINTLNSNHMGYMPRSSPRAMLHKKRETAIMGIIKKLERDYNRVFPFMVEPWLDGDLYISEPSIRRRMADMARRGLLERIGERKGYKLSD